MQSTSAARSNRRPPETTGRAHAHDHSRSAPGPLVPRTGQQLYARRVHSHSAGHRGCPRAHPHHPGAQSRLIDRRRPRMQLLRLLRPGVLLVVVLLIAATGCHDESGVHVLGLEIEGQRVLSTEEIRAVMTTTTGGVLPWSSRPPFNRETFQEDLVRIARLYEARGYPDARVSVVAADLNEKGDGIRLRIGIDEGEPIRIESIRLEGVDDLPVDLQAR